MKRKKAPFPAIDQRGCQNDLIQGLERLNKFLKQGWPGVWRTDTVADLDGLIENLKEHYKQQNYPHLAIYWQPPVPGIDVKDLDEGDIPF